MRRPDTKRRIAALLLLIGMLGSSTALAAVIEVAPGQSLSSGLEQARAGDTILVYGSRSEPTVAIDKIATIIGVEDASIRNTGGSHVIKVTSSDVRISGMTILGAPVSFVDDNAGILLEGVSGCIIDSNRFEENFFAVYLAKSRDCSVIGNQISGSATSETTSGNGIHLWYCRDIAVTGNTVAGHRDGVYFEFVEHSLIHSNHISENLRYGLHFMFSDSCIYRQNEFVRNGAGVAVMYTHAVTMVENRFEQNWGPSSYGLLLKEITDSEVRGNLFRQNTVGIYLEGCNRVTVTGNEITENGWGVKIMANAIGCNFNSNNFSENSFEVATNSRQNFSTFDGNFWSEYRGYDLDRDGVGDVPFRPVSLFSLVVEKNPPTLILLRSLVVDVIDLAEELIPILTPQSLVDNRPAMERFQ